MRLWQYGSGGGCASRGRARRQFLRTLLITGFLGGSIAGGVAGILVAGSVCGVLAVLIDIRNSLAAQAAPPSGGDHGRSTSAMK